MNRMTRAAPLRAHGEMGALLRTFDWSSTELGPPASWPASLTLASSICLASRFPMALFWGRGAYTLIYNDAYRSVLGSGKHPRSFGQSARYAWREIWDTVGPIIDGVFETGEPTWSEDLPISINRRLPAEDVYLTFSCSPIYEDRDRIGGVLAACTDTTDRVLYGRRLGVLQELGGRVPEGRTAVHVCQIAQQTLELATHSIAFSLFYLVERDRAWLVAASPDVAPHAAPEMIDLTARGASPWRLAPVVSTGAAQVVEDVFERAAALPGMIRPEPARSAVVLPLSVPGKREVTGVMVAGIPPRVVVDAGYRGFLDLVAGHVATAMASARTHHNNEHGGTRSLAELDRARTVFFRNISREFRTPLNLVLGPAEDALADTDDELPPPQRERIETMHRGAQRLLKLVNTLYDFSRLETGRIEACYGPADLGSLTSEVASVFRSVVERAGLRFVVECAPLPELAYVDRGMWEHIVLSLVSNAFKFTFKGEIAVRLTLDGNRVRLRVSDTGTGIRADELPNLFDRFHEITDRRGRTYEGTRLGLSLVHEMAKLHGGHVEVKSEPGSGSTFTVTIPTGRDHLPAACIRASYTPPIEVPARAYAAEAAHWVLEQVNASQQPSEAADNGRHGEIREEGPARANVLVVDDNTAVCTYLARVLGSEYDVRTATNSADAIHMARERTPSLLLADVMLPRMDGIELLRVFRNDPRMCMVPVVLMSALVEEEARAHGLENGADDYLMKPFTSRELRARVAAQLHMARIREAAIRRERELRTSLEAFLATLSHELRSPLQAAWAAVGVLRNRVPHERFLDVLDRQMAYLRRLVDDLLDVSRIAHGKIQLQQKRHDCRQLAAEAADIVRAAAAERHIELSVETPDEELAVTGDGVRLVEVLTNLLHNAIKYTGEGGHVLLRAMRSEASVEIRVLDSGQGIPREVLPRIFELFGQGVDGVQGGLGIGLAVAAQLVQLHGGTVEAHSDGPDHGSEFVVRLPAVT